MKKGAQKKVIGLLQNFEGLFGQISVSDQPMLNIKGIPVDVMINVYKDMRGILSQVRSLLKENGVEKEGAELIRQMQERLDTLKSRIKDAGGEVDTAMTGEIYTSIQEIFNAGLLGSPIIGRWVTIKTKTRGTIRMQVSRIPSKGTDITGLGEDDRSVTVTKAEFVRAKADAAMAADLYGNYEDMRIKAAKERASRRDIKFIVTFTDNGLEKKALVNGSNVGDVWADGLAVDEKRGLITTSVRFLPNQFIRAQVVSDAAMSSKPLSYGDRIEVKKNQTLYFRFNSYGAFDVQFHDDGVVTVNDANAKPGTSPGRVYSGKVFEFLKEGRHLANIYFEGNRLYVKNLSSEQFLYTAQTNAATVAKDVAMASDYDWRNRAAAEQQQIREHIVAREAIERIERRGVGVSSSEAARVLAAAEADQKAVADQPSYMWRAKTDAEQRVMGARIRLEEVQSREARHGKGDKAVIAQVNIPGGIDLNTSNGMQWKVSRDGNGVEMNIDLAMIARIRREGIDSLSPVILRMTPVASIWPLMGLQAPAK